jgi:hypothetical protein
MKVTEARMKTYWYTRAMSEAEKRSSYYRLTSSERDEIYDAVFDRLIRLSKRDANLDDLQGRETTIRFHSLAGMKDGLKKARRRARREQTQEERVLAVLAGPAQLVSSERRLEAVVIVRTVVDVRSELPKQQQAALDCALAGLSIAAQAAHTGRAMASACTLRQRALTAVHQKLAARGIGPLGSEMLSLVNELIHAGAYRRLIAGAAA